MKRPSMLIALVLVAISGLAVGGAAAGETFRAYTQPGEWFSPGEMYSSYYDWCGNWTENTFSKGTTAHGLITFIDPSGNWRYSKQGTGVLTRRLTTAEKLAVRKKPHCRNNSGAAYQGGCFAFIESTQCA
jgi:hypothetical protein